MRTRKYRLGLIATACSIWTAAALGGVQQTILTPPQVVNQWYYDFGGPPLVFGGTGSIDLNGDGLPDLTFINLVNSSVGQIRGFYALVQPASGVRVVRENFPPNLNYFQANPLAFGDSIGPSSNFSDVQVLLFDPSTANPYIFSSPPVDNQWGDQALHYLGFSLTSGGNTQYGWLAIRLGAITPVDFQHQLDGYQNAGNGIEIDSFALESNPNTPLAAGVVPEPTGSGVTMCAAIAFLLRRSRASIAADTRQVRLLNSTKPTERR